MAELYMMAEAAAAARLRMVLVKRLATNNLEKMIQEALTYIQTRDIERSDVYMDICKKLESAVDKTIAIDAVPSSSHIHQLLFIVKEVYRCMTGLLQPSLIQLMLPIKAACRVGWFPDEDKKALLMMAKKVSYGFSTLDKMNSEPIDAHKCVSTIISRFYPTMKLENILTSFDVKAGLGIFVADFHISWCQLPHDCQNLVSDQYAPHVYAVGIHFIKRLLVARKDNMDTAACIASPLNVDFLINGSAVPKRTKVDMGNGPQLPTNVFKMIRYGVNLLQVSGDFDASMNSISPPDPSLLQNYVNNMTDRGDSECEVGEMSSQISLCCPISQCRIKVPVKGQLCKHRQSFDYKSFMEINSVTPTWRCPHCDKPVCHLDIRIDQDFLKILNKEADDVSDVIIPANSSRMVVMIEKSQSTEKNRNITSQKEGGNTQDTPMQPLPAGNLALQQLGREGEQRQYTAPAQSQANIGTSKQVQLAPSATTSLDLSRGEKQRHYTAPSQHQAELGTADQAHRTTLITSSATRSPPSIALTFEQLMGRDKQQDGASGQSDKVNVGTTNQTQSQRSSHSVALAIDQLRIEGEQRHFTPVRSHPAPASATTPIPPPTSSVRSISPAQLPEVSGGAMPSRSMRGSLTGKQRAAAQLELLGQPRQPIRGNERWPLASLNQQPPPLTRFQNVSSSGNLPR